MLQISAALCVFAGLDSRSDQICTGYLSLNALRYSLQRTGFQIRCLKYGLTNMGFILLRTILFFFSFLHTVCDVEPEKNLGHMQQLSANSTKIQRCLPQHIVFIVSNQNI